MVAHAAPGAWSPGTAVKYRQTLTAHGGQLAGIAPAAAGDWSLMGVRQICSGQRVPLVAALFWLYMLQPDRNMLVSGVLAVHVASESTSERTVTTRQASSELPRRDDDLGYLQI